LPECDGLSRRRRGSSPWWWSIVRAPARYSAPGWSRWWGDVINAGSKEFAALIRTEARNWAEAVRASGAQLD
jgi:hypothetical protein